MNREQFYTRVAGLDEQQLRKTLWTLYWRGTAIVRERIETELDAAQHGVRPRPARRAPVDGAAVRHEVDELVTLARAGAYLAGDRRVSPKERTRWRFTFRRLATDAQEALRGDQPEDAESAIAQLVDLAGEVRDYDYFRSDDPIEAARFVVSDAVALLWASMLERYGFAGFAERAAPQLVRWESRYGWTRTGFGRVPEKETPLADVLARMLRVPDAWVTFTQAYVAALDQAAERPVTRRTAWRNRPEQRAGDLAAWHLLLLDHLMDTDAESLLDHIAVHSALGGPELQFFQARLARRRGDLETARDKVQGCLTTLPGHAEFLAFAVDIDAPMPERARQLLAERRRAGAC